MCAKEVEASVTADEVDEADKDNEIGKTADPALGIEFILGPI
ncbi:hypothetical protein [Polaromonas vacuolata]|nr:hypothetical protein [Polaromonas vacuolata]